MWLLRPGVGSAVTRSGSTRARRPKHCTPSLTTQSAWYAVMKDSPLNREPLPRCLHRARYRDRAEICLLTEGEVVRIFLGGGGVHSGVDPHHPLGCLGETPVLTGPHRGTDSGAQGHRLLDLRDEDGQLADIGMDPHPEVALSTIDEASSAPTGRRARPGTGPRDGRD